MLSFSGSLKVFVAVEACDMRKGFNGLHAVVTERLGEEPRTGALFVFSNRRHTRIKILCWDGTGLWVLSKRLERGTFAWPRNVEPGTIKLKLAPQALALLTDGVDLRGAIEVQPVKQKPDEWRCIGQEVSEQLDYEPARFLRRRTIRKKYVHRLDLNRAPLLVPLPERLLDRSLPAPGLLAQILVAKYCDHLPLYRQEQIFAQRHKINLPRQSLARWVELSADWLKPIYEHIRTGVLAGGYVQVDETLIDYLEPGNGKTKQGYLWTVNRPGGDVVYHWQTSRAAACLEQIIPENFSGIMQCDGYSGYRAFADRRSGIELAGCWAHVRRKFYDALEQSPRVAGWLVKQIQNLYRIETQLREHHSGRQLRQAVRSWQSRPVVQRIQQALIRLKRSGRYLPQSPLGQAIDYTLGQWPTLEICLNDGRIELDNNLVENAIRPTAIGKKNWLFIGEAGAGDRSAIIYTPIENCRRRGHDPFAYLRDVLTRLPNMTNRQIPEVTPQAWSKTPLQVQRQRPS